MESYDQDGYPVGITKHQQYLAEYAAIFQAAFLNYINKKAIRRGGWLTLQSQIFFGVARLRDNNRRRP